MDSNFVREMERILAIQLIVGMIVAAALGIGAWELGKYLLHHLSLTWR